MNPKTYEFEAVIHKVDDIDGAYIEIPFDVKSEFGKGRVPVTATFDEEHYEGSLVRMKTPCHIIGIRKEIRAKILAIMTIRTRLHSCVIQVFCPNHSIPN